MITFPWRKWLNRISRSLRTPTQPRRRREMRLRPSTRPQLEPLEDRTLLTVTLLNHFTGLDFNQSGGYEPPDNQGAAGPTSVVETTNQTIAIYNKSTGGTVAGPTALSTFWTTTGGLSRADSISEFSDPVVTWDEQIQRFIVADQDVDGHFNNGSNTKNASFLDIAISTSANPATLTKSDWSFFQINTTETVGTNKYDPDYPGNLGWNHDALVATLDTYDQNDNFFNVEVNSISLSALTSLPSNSSLTGNAFQNFITENPLRPAVMHDGTAGGPEWLVAESGTGSSIDVVKMTNVLSNSAAFTTTAVPVTPYLPAVPPGQPTGVITTDIDSRILKAAEYNGLLVASHTVGTTIGTDDARWYEFNVSGATPVLVQQGDVGGGTGVFDTYPAVDINAEGDIGMTYDQSGTNPNPQFISMYVTGRTPGDASGTMEPPVLVQAGTENYLGTRMGDLSAVNVDSNGTFWAVNEYSNNETALNANWGTAIANFTVGIPLQIVLTNATEGQQLTDVPVATFVDTSAASASGLTATIDWGDGVSSTGQVIFNGSGEFTITGSHQYTEEGDYTLTVNLFKSSGLLGSGSGTVHVADAPLIGGPPTSFNATVAIPLGNQLVATFTDTDQTNTPSDPQNNPADYTATVYFQTASGVPIVTAGNIVPLGGNSYAVYASPSATLPTGGNFPITVLIRDVGGASVTVTSNVTVQGNVAIPPLLPIYQADSGPVTLQWMALESALTNLLTAEDNFFFAQFEPPPARLQALHNLLVATIQYQLVAFQFDIRLPRAPGVPPPINLFTGQPAPFFG
jgi:hypothetical protein